MRQFLSAALHRSVYPEYMDTGDGPFAERVTAVGYTPCTSRKWSVEPPNRPLLAWQRLRIHHLNGAKEARDLSRWVFVWGAADHDAGHQIANLGSAVRSVSHHF
jgi:hypothetical protein